jgi:hypothetical protein
VSDPRSYSHAVPLWSVTDITGGIFLFQIRADLVAGGFLIVNIAQVSQKCLSLMLHQIFCLRGF